MVFKQRFDQEELPTVLNAFNDAGVKDDLFVVIHEANKDGTFVVKTPTGRTEERTIHNTITFSVHSSNMVDQNIGKEALRTKNTYMYKK